MTEVDQEFEDACFALATADGPRDMQSDRIPFEAPERVPPSVLTAADLAEDDPAQTTAEDLIPAVPFAASEAPPMPTAEPVIQTVDPVPDTASKAELESARAELMVARAELDALRADFQAERFRFQDERMHLEDELAAERERSAGDAANTDPLGGNPEVLTLRREVDALRGEMLDLRSGHADEIGRLESDLRAAQAREAQTVISAQLAEDELNAVRSDDSLEVTTHELVAARSEADALRQLVTELQANETERDRRLRTLEAELADRENELRIARESAADRIRSVEARLAATEAELAATQQELLDAEERRAEEAASFLEALHKK